MILADSTKKFRLLPLDEFQDLPPPTWLVEDTVPAAGQTMLYGKSGDGKSFLAVDLALSIASGRPWHGRAVRQGPIIYLAAEGWTGLAKRTVAWMHHYKAKEIPGAFFVADAPQLHVPSEVEALLDAIRGAPNLKNPALVVADTFARCFVGGDENTSQDVGRWIAGAGRIQTVTGGAFMTVHHTKKAQKKGTPEERGSSAFRGAADTMILVQKSNDGAQVMVTCEKQKDAEEFKPFSLRFEKVTWKSARGEQDSCVLVGHELADLQPGMPTPRQMTILQVMSGFPDGAPTGACIKVLEERGVPGRTFYAERTELEGKYVMQIKRGLYGLTPFGRMLVQPQTTCN